MVESVVVCEGLPGSILGMSNCNDDEELVLVTAASLGARIIKVKFGLGVRPKFLRLTVGLTCDAAL